MTDPQPRAGGDLRLPGDPELPEPLATHGHPMTAVARLCGRQLFTYRGDATPGSWQAVAPVPDLASAIPSIYNAGLGARGTSYVIRLRPNVFWDTEPPRAVVAQDVIRGLKRLCTPFHTSTALPYLLSTIRGLAEYRDGHPESLRTPADLAEYAAAHEIAGVFALDDETLVVELSHPALDLVDILAMPCVSPAPVEYDAYLPDSPEVRRNLRSTGPYRPMPGPAGRLVLAHNPAWRAESEPVRGRHLDTITITRDATGTDRPPAFLGLDPYLALNTRGPGPLRSRELRRAVARAVARSGPSGTARPAHTIVPPGHDGHQESTVDRPVDFTDAGRADGVELTVAHPDTRRGGAAARQVALDLAKIGAKVHLRPLAQPAYAVLMTRREHAEAGEWDIAVGSWHADWLHANGRAFLLPLCHSGSVTNPGGNGDPRVDELIDEALAAQDDPTRSTAALREAERRALADAAIIPVLFRPPPVEVPRDPAVRGLTTLSALGGALDLAGVWLDLPDTSIGTTKPAAADPAELESTEARS
ncbi:ABC transporter substrate-binding protein [Actinokineospora sp. NBRC 105648]|uniref:ABC transporter substrate-binding protein n=1 Tax=Actinokineospora sp. NBRC 105648 TaxID=3032206 RepID=UPI0024A043B7|nr:ABC transporter substrate-binding protein [Actinokineospora sp. NBRC 105648]GLZ42294.1 hypothetical protein Acsp05_59180 [Actinokineospora sp. NBRC 105648]